MNITVSFPSQSSGQPRLSNKAARGISLSPSYALKKIEFRLAAVKAKTVQLAADFTNWHKAPIRMARNSAGVWEARVCLAPGKYRYRYLVDADVPRQSESAEQLPLPFSFGTLYGELEVR